MSGTGCFTSAGNGLVAFDSTAKCYAKFNNVVSNDGVYPKTYTVVAYVQGKAGTTDRVLEIESAFPDTTPTSPVGARVKEILRNDKTNVGLQIEQYDGTNSANYYDTKLVMTNWHIYQTSVVLTGPQTGTTAVYMDGNLVSFASSVKNPLEAFRAATNASDNYISIGSNGTNTYHGVIDWIVWTSSGAYTPAQLKGKLPPNVGTIPVSYQ